MTFVGKLRRQKKYKNVQFVCIMCTRTMCIAPGIPIKLLTIHQVIIVLYTPHYMRYLKLNNIHLKCYFVHNNHKCNTIMMVNFMWVCNGL